MKLLPKIKSVLANPAMFCAYARWMSSRALKSRAPRIAISEGASVGEWLSFSEYWSFKEIVPVSERVLIERCLLNKGKETVAIDIGANVGAFTCLFASMKCRVHAFEPIPETFCRLKSNVKFNGFQKLAYLNCLAVGKEKELVSFKIQQNSPATNKLAMPEAASSTALENLQTVAAVGLDEYCAAHGINRIDFLKIDVEGMEPFVLQSAKKLFAET